MIGLGWMERQNWEGNGYLLFHERKEGVLIPLLLLIRICFLLCFDLFATLVQLQILFFFFRTERLQRLLLMVGRDIEMIIPELHGKHGTGIANGVWGFEFFSRQSKCKQR